MKKKLVVLDLDFNKSVNIYFLTFRADVHLFTSPSPPWCALGLRKNSATT